MRELSEYISYKIYKIILKKYLFSFPSVSFSVHISPTLSKPPPPPPQPQHTGLPPCFIYESKSTSLSEVASHRCPSLSPPRLCRDKPSSWFYLPAQVFPPKWRVSGSKKLSYPWTHAAVELIDIPSFLKDHLIKSDLNRLLRNI
jgi:hypothetical protein